MQELGRWRRPPRRRSPRVGARRLEGGVGHHFCGDAERAGMESRVERAGQALALDGLDPGPATAPAASDSVSETTSARSSAFDQLIELPGGRLHHLDPPGVPHRMGIAVTDQCGRPMGGSLPPLWVTASAGAGSVDQCSSRIMALLLATHSTRPTSLDSATAPDAAPTGG